MYSNFSTSTSTALHCRWVCAQLPLGPSCRRTRTTSVHHHVDWTSSEADCAAPFTRMLHVPREFSAQLRHKHEVEGLRPVEVRAWAKSVGYDLTAKTIRYHIKGRTHPKVKGTSIANNGNLQEAIHRILLEDDERTLSTVQSLLCRRDNISVGMETARRARQSLLWSWGSLRATPMIRDVNKQKRVVQATEWLRTGPPMHNAMFTDETSIALEHYSRRCYRLPGRVVQKPVAKHPLKLHVWGGITSDGPGPCVIFSGIMDGEYFRDAIVDKALVPWLNSVCPEDTAKFAIYMDNDPKHTASAKYMESKGINWVRTPPESPDLNPIEMVWAHLKWWLRTTRKPTNMDDLVNAIEEYWEHQLSPAMCRKYIRHIGRVLPKVIELHGAATGM